MQTFRVKVNPGNREYLVEEGTLVLDLLMDQGYALPTPCGGKGICGKCKVWAEGSLSEPTGFEQRFPGVDRGYRLACQTYITGDAVLFLDEEKNRETVADIPIERGSDIGFAVDIGTTSVKVAVVDYTNGIQCPVDSFLNPQRRYGHDVVGRIAASSDPDARQKLEHQIRSSVFTSIQGIMKRYSLTENQIQDVVFSGNTTMLYFLFGMETGALGVHPYTAHWKDFEGYTLRDIRPEEILPVVPEDIPVYGLAAASAYLGGDLVGGAAYMEHEGYNDCTFFIDVGTNGEIYLHFNGAMFATSCAMGPALEGMNISHGMTADEGAINHFWLEDDRLKYSVMGNTRPVGISGTGLIDIIAILLRQGLVETSGAFSDSLKNDTVGIKGIACSNESRSIVLEDSVSVTQKDIRNIQLAKGASLAAGKMLLMKSGIDPEQIKQVVIAGAFGENLFIDNFKQLKFIPDFPNAEYLFLGNTSLKAASMYCYDREFRKGLREFRDRIEVIELTGSIEFNDMFMDSFDFGGPQYS